MNLIPSTAQRRRWFEIVKRERTLLVYLLSEPLIKLSNLIGLIHGPSCYLPLKPFSLRHFQQPRGFLLVTAVVRKPFVETPSTHWTFHSAVPSPFFLEIELAENQCQSVSPSVSKSSAEYSLLSSRGVRLVIPTVRNEATV